MAQVVVTLKIMPENVDVDLVELEKSVKEKINEFNGFESEMRSSIEPVAFGLKSINIIFVMDEAMGSPDPLVNLILTLEGVSSAEVVDVRRAIG